MKKLAHAMEKDTFEWDVEVIITEVSPVTQEWRIDVMTPGHQVTLDRMTRGQVGLLVAALRRAVVVASVKVNPLDMGNDDEL